MFKLPTVSIAMLFPPPLILHTTHYPFPELFYTFTFVLVLSFFVVAFFLELLLPSGSS